MKASSTASNMSSAYSVEYLGDRFRQLGFLSLASCLTIQMHGTHKTTEIAVNIRGDLELEYFLHLQFIITWQWDRVGKRKKLGEKKSTTQLVYSMRL